MSTRRQTVETRVRLPSFVPFSTSRGTYTATAKLHVMSDLPEIERSIEVPASPDEVWERVVDGDLSEEWMGVRLDPRPGGPVEIPDRDMIGTVEEVTPGESITWSWRDVDGDPSQVTVAIEPTQKGTRVTVVERLLEYRIVHTTPVFFSQAA